MLYELRNALRSGDIWLETSRRYEKPLRLSASLRANPETYLIPKDCWQTLKNEVCHQISAPQEAQRKDSEALSPRWRLTERQTELEELLEQVDTMLAEEYRSTGHSDAEGVRLQSGDEADGKCHRHSPVGLQHRDGRVRIENGELVISPLEGEERPESAVALEGQIDRRLPLVELTNLLVEVDRWTQCGAQALPLAMERTGETFA